MGLLTPRSGTITFDGQALVGKRAYTIAALGIGYVPEHRAIFRALSVEENLQIAERKRGDLAKRSDLIFELFPDLKTFLSRGGGNLSGGQQQMLAIARALVPENRLLLIDEPSEGLAPIIVENIARALKRLAGETTVLLVEQNFRMASQVADHYVIVDDGRAVKAGAMVDLVADPAVARQYLGVG
jgi:branched-chain amino acid transport system ATP-binding protein